MHALVAGVRSMETTLSLSSSAALFGTLALLAAVPSVSVLAVSARSATFGFIHGAFTAMGLVAGDIIFILLAIFGLVLLVEALGSMFFLIKYVGGAYLIWLGVGLWRSRPKQTERKQVASPPLLSSFMTGLLITLGDQKAILFYLGFLPAFLDLPALAYIDIGMVVVITIVAVGGVKLGYAYAADRAGLLFGDRTGEAMNVIAACVMVMAGVFVIART